MEVILTELPANVSSCAFVGKDEGRVLVKMAKVGSRATLTVEDIGIGFDERIMASKKGALGTAIVNVPAAR